MTISEATRLDGKVVAAHILAQIKHQVEHIKSQGDVLPKLTVILVGEDPASEVYVNRKASTAREVGIISEVLRFEADLPEAELMTTLDKLNADPSVHGILVQLPLPKHIHGERVLNRICPSKDVDGFHPLSVGQLATGNPPPALPCTPAGILAMLDYYQIPLQGKHVVVLGRSNIVGKPAALLLLQRDATVTLCHSKTKNLAHHLQQADILVAAVGVPELVQGEMLKAGVVVIDVGMNRIADPAKASGNRLVGDVHYESASKKASFITPVPGGVGPMTIACLLQNTLSLYQAANNT